MKRSLPTVAAGAIAALAAVVLTGCGPAAGSGSEGGSRVDSDTLRVVATTTQVADFTQEIAGGAAEVVQLIEPNQSAHGYDPSAADLLALQRADVVVMNGAGLEEWLHDAVTASGFDGLLIDASTGIDLDGSDDADDAHGAAGRDTGDDHGDDGDAGEDAHAEHGDAAGTDDHDHASGNPHIWTDPRQAEQMVETIAAGLAATDPAHAAGYRANAGAYSAKLEALDDWTRANIDTVPAARRLLVSNHDAFSYFVDAYDLRYVGSVIPSFDDNAEPSAAEIDALVAAIRKTGATAVFSEASLSPKVAATIAREADVTVYDGDDALYSDSLGPAGSAGASYLGAQLHNVRVLLDSWGVTPTALPAGLEE